MKKIFPFKKSKLRTKLIISFLFILLIPSVAIGFSSYQKAQAVLGDEILESAKEDVNLVNKKINETFEPKLVDVTFFSKLKVSNHEEISDQIHEQFAQYLELHPGVSAVYLGTDAGDMVVEPALDLPADYDPREREWYKKAMESEGEAVITDPYADAASDAMMITIAKSTADGAGVIGIDINITKIAEYTNAFAIGENGYVILLDSQNRYLVHPTNKIGTDPEEEWTEAVFNKDSGKYSYTLDGEEKELAFTTNEITGWKILGTMYKNEITAASSDILMTTLLVISAALVAGIMIILIIVRSITQPLTSLTASVKKIREGDLSQPIETISKDEIGQLAQGITDMQNSLKEVINNLSNASENLSSHSEELTQSATEVKDGSTQIASTMQELASGTESQANNANDLSVVMESFMTKMQEANENGEGIYLSSKEVLNWTSEGAELMEGSVRQMSAIDKIVQEAVQKVKGLDAQSQEITKLVSVIKDIADQTNLLALNAAIEAARAGEHGKGFAVVADEVRKLAEQVGVSVNDITGIVNSIQIETTGVVESLEGGYEEVEKGAAQIKTTGETFTGIDKAVKEMAERIKTVTNNLAAMVSSSQEMGTSVEEIASVAEEAAAGVEQTAASAQQASSSMEEVAGSSDELSRLAEELNGLVRKFKV
ncbi:methyl-accepting chemotaxis protein [Thalassobacillus pellis]|uniref:methyl-accepting chemotaxis protein n=1 Tax=Thalassobacillus pellis TaxID=748008 RepID=UPI0019603BC6|nr:methyl-accepting chemotaxis protein [Thalassobacillus pellis]MBM7552648.1 methyl-accepting chemotaxis protein [Thalassobacillus pellis]